MQDSSKSIYDFGMNNGDDFAYYLTMSDRAVAVEANAALCRALSEQMHLALGMAV